MRRGAKYHRAEMLKPIDNKGVWIVIYLMPQY